MRVVVATDAIGALPSAQAGRALASGWSATDVTVVPVGEAGHGFVQAVADGWGVEPAPAVQGIRLLTWAERDGCVVVAVAPEPAADAATPEHFPTEAGLPLDSSSTAIGEAVRSVLECARRTPRQLLLDCAGTDVHDAGAGVLGALGAIADVPLDGGCRQLAGITRLDLQPARELLGGCELVGVVPDHHRNSHLLGLRGITSVRGRAAGHDAEELLAVDATLERFAQLAAPGATGLPGAGACGGIGLAVLALGGRLTTGPALAFDAADVRSAVAAADLVVTGCSRFDFATRGGGVVAAAAAAAATAMVPCIAVALDVQIGNREMRTMGVEAAYPVVEASTRDGQPVVSAGQLAAAAARVARTWRW